MELISPSDWAKQQVRSVQDYAILAGRSITALFTRPRYLADTTQQADLIGVGSLPIVILTGFFTGGALAQNSADTLKRFGSLSLIGQLVSLGIVRELGPVITGLMAAGRNASGIASELGSMIVTEQVDAMRALGTDPIRKLVTPRMIAMVTMLPLLVAVADFVGLVGGFVVAYFTLRLGAVQFWTRAVDALEFGDLVQGLSKPVIFGFVISTIGCFQGLRVKGGTQGVGRATTSAVVVSSVLVLVIDFFLAKLLLYIF